MATLSGVFGTLSPEPTERKAPFVKGDRLLYCGMSSIEFALRTVACLA